LRRGGEAQHGLDDALAAGCKEIRFRPPAVLSFVPHFVPGAGHSSKEGFPGAKLYR
jgi:hypothetical protein